MRRGEHVALRANRVDAARRLISIDRQVIETRPEFKLVPKSRRKRVTMVPATPRRRLGWPHSSSAALAEVGPDGLMVASPQGQWAPRSNFGRNLFDPPTTVG